MPFFKRLSNKLLNLDEKRMSAPSSPEEIIEVVVNEFTFANSSLCIAATSGNLKDFIDAFKEEATHSPILLKKAMIAAASNGHIDIVMYILNHSVNSKMYHSTAIKNALVYKQEDLIEVLLSIPNFNRNMQFRENDSSQTASILDIAILLDLRRIINLIEIFNSMQAANDISKEQLDAAFPAVPKEDGHNPDLPTSDESGNKVVFRL